MSPRPSNSEPHQEVSSAAERDLPKRLVILLLVTSIALGGAVSVSKYLAREMAVDLTRETLSGAVVREADRGDLRPPVLMMDSDNGVAIVTKSFLESISAKDHRTPRSIPMSERGYVQDLVGEVLAEGIDYGDLVEEVDVMTRTPRGKKGVGRGYVFSLDRGVVIFLVPPPPGSYYYLDQYPAATHKIGRQRPSEASPKQLTE